MPIKIKNLNYSYDSRNQIFKNLNVEIDENWKLGLIGKNGAGKTTLLKLLMDKNIKEISSNLKMNYFPIKIINESLTLQSIIDNQFFDIEMWKIYRELNLLDFSLEKLEQKFNTLSGGEKVKFQFAILFAEDDSFVLLDEPTNHLDEQSKEKILNYLKSKKGFILASHDRWLLDNTIDHTLTIDNMICEIQKGNYSVWEENYNLKLEYEKSQYEMLEKDIDRLEVTKRKTLKWAEDAEKAKSKSANPNQAVLDRGYFGGKSAKAMKRAKVIENRIENKIEDKKQLLTNYEKQEEIKLYPIQNGNKTLINCQNLSAFYGKKLVFKDMTIEIKSGERVALLGANGSGKTTFIKLLLKENISFTGNIFINNGIKISYLSQETNFLKGTLLEFSRNNQLDYTLLLTLLKKLGLKREVFENNLENLSDGQKKKVLLASSLITPADLYIWDEPFNFIDIITMLKIENLILKYKPTMIFVEHDKFMIKKLATKTINF